MNLGEALAAAAETDQGVSPLFFVLGALALIIVSTLGPLSRWHERRDASKHRPAAPESDEGRTD